MGNVASIPTDPTATLQVIGAGFPRTGTKSMQLALEILLDGPVMHGGTQIFCREDAYVKNIYHAHLSRDQNLPREVTLKHVRAMTSGFLGITDLPGVNFIPEMLELYPAAKVVLVTRDRDRWWKSFGPIAMRGGEANWWMDYVFWPFPGWRWVTRMERFYIGPREYTTSSADDGEGKRTVAPAMGPEFMDAYMDHVRAVVPKGRLLEMDISEGWQPLCEFLGKPVPVDTPFPRVNDSVEVEAYAKSIMMRVALGWVGILVTTGFGVYGGWRVVRG